MPQYRISEAAALLGVSDDTVRRWVDDGRLEASVDAAGRKVVDGADLARHAQELHAAPTGRPGTTASGARPGTGSPAWSPRPSRTASWRRSSCSAGRTASSRS